MWDSGITLFMLSLFVASFGRSSASEWTDLAFDNMGGPMYLVSSHNTSILKYITKSPSVATPACITLHYFAFLR